MSGRRHSGGGRGYGGGNRRYSGGGRGYGGGNRRHSGGYNYPGRGYGGGFGGFGGGFIPIPVPVPLYGGYAPVPLAVPFYGGYGGYFSKGDSEEREYDRIYTLGRKKGDTFEILPGVNARVIDENNGRPLLLINGSEVRIDEKSEDTFSANDETYIILGVENDGSAVKYRVMKWKSQ